MDLPLLQVRDIAQVRCLRRAVADQHIAIGSLRLRTQSMKLEMWS